MDSCEHNDAYACFDCEALAHRLRHPEPEFDCDWCKISSISIGFHSTPGGRAEFHGATIKERFDKSMSDARAAGIEPEPVGYRHI